MALAVAAVRSGEYVHLSTLNHILFTLTAVMSILYFASVLRFVADQANKFVPSSAPSSSRAAAKLIRAACANMVTQTCSGVL